MRDLFELSARMVTRNNRVFQRYLLAQHPFSSSMTILLGQRGVGKTTMIAQYVINRYKDPFSQEFLYVPMDHFIVGARSMYEIAETFEKVGGQLICFDEIHKYPTWSKELKSVNDSFPDLQVIASGSSALAVRQGSHDLSRRAVVRILYPLSFREWLTINDFGDFPVFTLPDMLANHRSLAGQVSNQLREKRTTVLSEFARYLQVGYYPYSLAHENAVPDFLLTLEQSVHTTVENDLPSLFPSLTGGSVHKIKQLLATISGLVPFKPDMTSLKRALQIGDERTLKTYLNHLEGAGIVRSLRGQGKSLNRLNKPEKLYLDNPNLMAALSGDRVNVGNARETFFLSCFRTSEVTSPPKGDFLVDECLFEVGGKNKDFTQIAGLPNSYLALDQIETGMGNRIPLWLFGFLY